MDYKEEIKKSATSELTKKVIGLLLLLVSVLLSALLFSFRYRIWPGLTKTQVGLLLVGSVLLNLGLLLAYLLKLRPDLKRRKDEISALQVELDKIKAALPYEFGARWTQGSEPRCPYCEGVLINYIGRVGNHKMSTFTCSGCGRPVQLKDSDGAILLLHEAQTKLSVINHAPSSKSFERTARLAASQDSSSDES